MNFHVHVSGFIFQINSRSSIARPKTNVFLIDRRTGSKQLLSRPTSLILPQFYLRGARRKIDSSYMPLGGCQRSLKPSFAKSMSAI